MSDTAPIPQALGICLEEYEYPYPVGFLPLSSDLQPVSMAYMDIPPGSEPNGKTVVLIHGKAFGCYQDVRWCGGVRPVVEAGGPRPGLGGRFCCSMYWRGTLIGAPPADPARYDPDHSRFARQ